MSNNEAKFLLNAYRPNGQDANDPALQAALAQAKTDPALAAWFTREQAHAAAVSAKLREITPPPGLREAILAGGRATGSRATKSNRFAMVPWLAMAAGIMLVAALTFILLPKRAGSADALVAFALEDVAHGRHGGHGEAQTALQTTLSDPSVHVAAGLPVDFARLKNTGCRTLQVAGYEVLEVCFVRNGAEFHCYIAKAGGTAAAQVNENTETFVQRGALSAVAWTKAGYRFVVASDAGLDAVKRLL